MTTTLLAALAAGVVVGPLARLLVPRHRGTPPVTALVLGGVGAVLGAWIYVAASGSSTAGVDWTATLVGALVAAALIVGSGLVAGDHRHDA